MNLPNRITLIRIAAAPLLLVVLKLQDPMMQWVSAVIFILASLTDLLDGYLARSRNAITDLGKFIDPIADKLLITAAMIVLVGQGRMEDWALALFIAREFIISAYRMVSASRGTVIAADRWGKYKTLAQTVAVPMIILLKPFDGNSALLGETGIIIADVFTYIALALSVYSCVNYILANKDILRSE